MPEIRSRKWVDDSHLPPELPSKLKQIYASRGVSSPSQLERSLKVLLHYKTLNGMSVAVSLLADAIEQQMAIMLIGDFDADGATSTALCLLALSQMGSKNHAYLVPNRFDFGYGLSPQIVEVAQQQGAELIVTVDSGIACHAGVSKANELGMQVIVTDHHLPGEQLPTADAIVNPNQPGCDFASKNLAGVGVAFYVMLALRAELQQRGWFEEQKICTPNLAELLDVVALGTIADVVPLDANNRILVHQGLQRIRSGHCRPGIQAMIDVAGRNAAQMQSSDLGFVLGPRLNAAGRLDDMSLGIECLLAQDVERARQIAVQLDGLNRERRQIQSSMQQEADNALTKMQLDTDNLPPALVLYEADYHQGVIGILAGRIKDKHYRPTIAFAHQDDTIIKGSARSIPGLHIRDLLDSIDTQYPDLIEKFGGHAMAAGLSIKLHNLSKFEQALQQATLEKMAGRPLNKQILTDGELSGDEFSLDFALQLKQAGPWGQGFEEPIFSGQFELVEQKIVGKSHLKMLLRQSEGEVIDAIAFNVSLDHWPDNQVSRVKLAYKLDINEFRGRTSLQLLVEALEKVDA